MIPFYDRDLANNLVLIFRSQIALFREHEKTDSRPIQERMLFSNSINKLEQLTNEMELTGVVK